MPSKCVYWEFIECQRGVWAADPSYGVSVQFVIYLGQKLGKTCAVNNWKRKYTASLNANDSAILFFDSFFVYREKCPADSGYHFWCILKLLKLVCMRVD